MEEDKVPLEDYIITKVYILSTNCLLVHVMILFLESDPKPNRLSRQEKLTSCPGIRDVPFADPAVLFDNSRRSVLRLRCVCRAEAATCRLEM